MDDVIENCHNTFEEDGVSQQTLEDLKTVSGPALASQSFGFILISLFPPKIFPSSKYNRSLLITQMIWTLFAATSKLSLGCHCCGRDQGFWDRLEAGSESGNLDDFGGNFSAFDSF